MKDLLHYAHWNAGAKTVHKENISKQTDAISRTAPGRLVRRGGATKHK
jgi:hypothetical protein